MKFKKITKKNCEHQNRLGKIILDTRFLIDEDGNEYLEKEEINLISREIAYRFYKEKYNKILFGEEILSPENVYEIIYFFDINSSQFSKIIGVNRSTITNILHGKRPSKQICLLIMSLIKEELMFPGYCKSVLNGNLKHSFDQKFLNRFIVAA
jgi:DNA-binding XRE family transcriptional regulator